MAFTDAVRNHDRLRGNAKTVDAQDGTDSHNVNVNLNFLTIDDLIFRAMWKSGMGKTDSKAYEKAYRDQFGREVFGGKTVLVRGGIDCPVDAKGRISGVERIRRAIPTLRELAGYGARVLLLGHQGRAGKRNFIELEQHARAIRRLLNKRGEKKQTVRYLGNLCQERVVAKRITSLKNGEILVLNNVRFLVDEVFIRDKPGMRPHEVNEGSRFVGVLEPLVDFYVNDAFNTSHRKHTSMIGFTNVLNLVGRHAENEMRENKEVLHTIDYPFVPVFGGVKVGDYMGLIKNSVLSDKVPHVLLGGAPGIIALQSREIRPGERYGFGESTEKFLEKNVSKALVKFFESLYTYPEAAEKLVTPTDFLVKWGDRIMNLSCEEIHDHPNKDDFFLWSIGERTTEDFVSHLLRAKTIYKKGPVGKAEEEGFEKSERAILNAIMEAQAKGAYTITSGGDSVEIAIQLGFKKESLFSRLSDAGGAFVHVLEGNRIAWPMLQLNTHWNLFYERPLRFGLPFNYTLKSRYRLELTVPSSGVPEALRHTSKG
jgi:phosphoglycerate kinase